MTRALTDKVAFVTGAGSGIGRATAQRFVQEGARVAVADLNGEAARSTVELLDDGGLAIELNVLSETSVAAGVDAVVEHYGKMDIVVNNAGVCIPGRVDDLEVEAWDATCDTNLKGVYLVSRAAWPVFVDQGGGCVINTASVAGLVGSRNRVAYAASKAGVVMLTKCMALDWAAANVRVNCVCPGYVDTPMVRDLMEQESDPLAARTDAAALHPLGRLGAPTDIADAMVFLASAQASWITGTALVVDGGLITGW